MATDRRPQFGAVPIRAMSDPSLSGLELRALVCIAWHDGFGHNGLGCTAGVRTIAEELGCDRSRAAAAIGALERGGFIASEPMATDARRRAYRVIYEDEDGLPISNLNELRDGNLSKSVAGLVAIPVATVGIQDAEISSETRPKRGKRENILKIDTPKVRTASSARARLAEIPDDETHPTHGLVAPVERILKERSSEIDSETLASWAAWLENAVDRCDPDDERGLAKRCERVADAIAGELAVRAAGL